MRAAGQGADPRLHPHHRQPPHRREPGPSSGGTRRAQLREPRGLERSVRPLLRRPRRLGDRGDRPGEIRRLVERRRREPEHRERRRRQGARPAGEGLQRQRGVLARARVRRLRLDLPDHEGAAAVLRGPDRCHGQGDGSAGEPRHRPWPSDLNCVTRASCPCSKASREVVPRRCHRPGERDPPAADHQRSR